MFFTFFCNMFGVVLNGYYLFQEVDFIPYPFETTVENRKRLFSSDPFWILDYTLLQPWPRKESTLGILYRPLTPTVCFTPRF